LAVTRPWTKGGGRVKDEQRPTAGRRLSQEGVRANNSLILKGEPQGIERLVHLVKKQENTFVGGVRIGDPQAWTTTSMEKND